MSAAWISTAVSPQGVDPEKVEPGLLGFSWFVALFVAVLLRGTLRRSLRRLDASRTGDRQERTKPEEAPPGAVPR